MSRSKIQVLVVEDNEEHAMLLARLLSGSELPRFAVATVRTLAEAMEKLKHAKPEAILLDLTLSDSQGAVTFRKMNAAAPDVPIVILSGSDDVALAGEMVKNGAQDYLVKGHVDNHLLIRSVQYAVERKRSQADLNQAHSELEARVKERTAALAEANEKLQREIAERKHAEQVALESNAQLTSTLAELRQMQRDLLHREHLQALGQMANGIAHEFNNLLTPIVGYTEHLLRQPEILANQTKARDYIEKIHNAALLGARAVSRVRDFARSESGGLEPVAVDEIVTGAIALTEPKWKDEARAAGVTIRVVQQVKEVPTVHGDAAQLRELLAHLIFNAVKAISRRGNIHIGASRRSNEVVLTVQDDGAGMSEAHRRRCLDSRELLAGTDGRLSGYAVIHNILARHSGRLEIDSREGRGTKVSVILEIGPRPGAAPRRAPGIPSAPKGAPKGRRILVVDDEPMVREVINIYLSEDGHQVELAADGREALEKFKASHYNLVLTDRAMPELNGDQLAREVKQLKPAVPVILLTGFGDLMNCAGEKPEGVDAVVAKPFTLAGLRTALAPWC